MKKRERGRDVQAELSIPPISIKPAANREIIASKYTASIGRKQCKQCQPSTKMDSVDQLLEKNPYFTTPGAFVYLCESLSDALTEDEINEGADLSTTIKVKRDINNSIQQKEYYDAIAVYTEAISKLQGTNDPKCIRAIANCYQNRAAAYEELKMYDHVVADATRAIDMNELYAKAYYRRSNAYVGQNKFYSALQDIVHACVLEKFRNKTYNRIAADINARFGKYFFYIW